jgi:hypothetical protein
VGDRRLRTARPVGRRASGLNQDQFGDYIFELKQIEVFNP